MENPRYNHLVPYGSVFLHHGRYTGEIMNTITDANKLAMCKACTIADVMKDCKRCAFNVTGKDKNPGISAEIEHLSENVEVRTNILIKAVENS
jgi:hypothetical protein